MFEDPYNRHLASTHPAHTKRPHTASLVDQASSIYIYICRRRRREEDEEKKTWQLNKTNVNWKRKYTEQNLNMSDTSLIVSLSTIRSPLPPTFSTSNLATMGQNFSYVKRVIALVTNASKLRVTKGVWHVIFANSLTPTNNSMLKSVLGLKSRRVRLCLELTILSRLITARRHCLMLTF